MMKNLTKYIYQGKNIPIREYVAERLVINKNYGINDNLSFDDVTEAYIVSWYNFDKTFIVGKCKIDNIVMINNYNDLIRYSVSGTGSYFGFKDLQFKLIKNDNILYYDGPRKRILIHPEDKERLIMIKEWVDDLEYGSKYSIGEILETYLGIDSLFYNGKLTEKFKCYNGEGSIDELKNKLANTISKL